MLRAASPHRARCPARARRVLRRARRANRRRQRRARPRASHGAVNELLEVSAALPPPPAAAQPAARAWLRVRHAARAGNTSCSHRSLLSPHNAADRERQGALRTALADVAARYSLPRLFPPEREPHAAALLSRGCALWSAPARPRVRLPRATPRRRWRPAAARPLPWLACSQTRLRPWLAAWRIRSRAQAVRRAGPALHSRLGRPPPRPRRRVRRFACPPAALGVPALRLQRRLRAW
jgi:hypothetical protein